MASVDLRNFAPYFIDIDLYEQAIPANGVIPAGTMFIVDCVDEIIDTEGRSHGLPDFTLLLAGQNLSREMYPELSRIFSGTGGFYEFTMPDLRNKFLLGFDMDSKPIYGSGAIYYEDVGNA